MAGRPTVILAWAMLIGSSVNSLGCATGAAIEIAVDAKVAIDPITVS